jgi:cell shape-determining protein MreD
MHPLSFFAAPFLRSSFRFAGLIVACVCVVLPALPWFAQPPVPLAPLWCAYGWAAEGDDRWPAPVALALLGLVQDQLAGGPLGFYALIFVGAYGVGKLAASTMRSANLISPWVGFGATAVGACVIATALAMAVLGNGIEAARPFVVTAFITALLFPLVRPLYLGGGSGSAGASS